MDWTQVIIVLIVQVVGLGTVWLKQRADADTARAAEAKQLKVGSDAKLAAEDAAAKAAEAKTAAAVAASKALAVADQVKDVAHTVDIVHTLTNSGMTEVREELKAARVEIRQLQQARVEQALQVRPLEPRPAGATETQDGIPTVAAPVLVVLPAPAATNDPHETAVPDDRTPMGRQEGTQSPPHPPEPLH